MVEDNIPVGEVGDVDLKAGAAGESASGKINASKSFLGGAVVVSAAIDLEAKVDNVLLLEILKAELEKGILSGATAKSIADLTFAEIEAFLKSSGA